MRRQLQEPGVRKWSGDDLLDLQNTGLMFLDLFFSQYGNCIIAGCEMNGNKISEGLVSIGSELMPFVGPFDIDTFPVYIKKSEFREQREYADGVVRDISVMYYAEITYIKPEYEFDYIEVQTKGAVRFFDHINSDWLGEIEKLQLKDLAIMSILQQLDIPTLLTGPTSITLTYTKDGKTYSFWIGQQCRVLDNESKKYTFYQLYAINNGVADWQIIGAGMYKTPTLTKIPTKDTLTFLQNGIMQDFLIGQQCRVYDNNNKKYVFYQLYDIDSTNKAHWQISGSDGSANEETVTIILESNQGANDISLIGRVVSISWPGQEKPLELVWNGILLSATIPMSVKYKVSVESMNGYTDPQPLSFLAFGGNKRQVSFVYSCEKIVVTVTADDGTVASSRTVTIKHGATDAILGSGISSSVTIKVPIGIPYKIFVDYWPGFIKPSEQSFTANEVRRDVLFEYERIVDAVLIFNTEHDQYPGNISGAVNNGVIAKILSKFRRCLCKKTADGEVTIIYLDINNSTIFEDGTSADLTGAQGDVMVDFPEFYYKFERGPGAYEYSYRIAEFNINGSFNHVPRSLVGAYKACVLDGKLCSRSATTPTTNITFTEFSTAAQAQGIGYQLIDFQQHCVIAFMLYAKYGTRQLYTSIGSFSALNPPIMTGENNLLGNNDTSHPTKTYYINGLGLEGVYGSIAEWVRGISISGNTWTITDPNGLIRSINMAPKTGWIRYMSFERGPFFDMVPGVDNYGAGGATLYYCCKITVNNALTDLGFLRSGYGATTDGMSGVVSTMLAGITYVNDNCGTRLAFRGIVNKAASISSFKAL